MVLFFCFFSWRFLARFLFADQTCRRFIRSINACGQGRLQESLNSGVATKLLTLLVGNGCSSVR